MGRPELQITSEALGRLRDYTWPGNVRQLQNAIEYAVVLAKENVITADSLPPELALPVELRDELAMLSTPITHRRSESAANIDLESASLNLDDRERRAILQALAQTHGNKLKAAKMLGIHRPTLYNKMKRYGIAVGK